MGRPHAAAAAALRRRHPRKFAAGLASPPTAPDVEAAAARLAASKLIHRTPLLESLALNNLAGGRACHRHALKEP